MAERGGEGGGSAKKEQKHPLRGRAGEGPPIAPPGWRWKAGRRPRDMYFYSPSGGVFRSHVQLNTYLASHPGSPSASEFRWVFRETDFQEGPPGTPVEQRRGIYSDPAQNKRRKLQVDDEKDDDHHTASPRASTWTTSGHLSPSRKHRSKKEYGLNYILSSPTGYRVLLRNSEGMRKFLEEAAQLGEKSETEINELRGTLLIKAQDLMSLRKYPKNALRVFFYLLRNEEAPSCFGVTELSDLCNSWLCKNMRPWCLRETHRIQSLAEKLQRQAQKIAVEQVTMPGSQTKGSVAAGAKVEVQEIHGDAVDLDDANQDQAQEQPSVVGGRCKCKACSSNPSFCSGCECNICKDVVRTKENWSYLKCEKCSHVCHLDCALKARRAGVVQDFGLDVEFLCSSCPQKNDLSSFWKDQIKDALAVVDRGLLEKHLSAAVGVMTGTGRSAYQAIHAKVEELHNAIVYGADCPDLHELLRQIGVSLGDLQQLGDYDDKFLDQSLLAEILQEDTTNIQVEEAKVAEYQKKAEHDYVLWLKAEKHADGRRSLVKQLTQQLEIAEEEVKLRADCAASSRMLFQKSQKKLEMLDQIRGAQGISKERMQLQRSIFNRELSELQILQDKVVSLKPETWDGYLSQLSVLLEAMKRQRKSVESAQERLEGLIALHKLVK